MLKNRRNRNNEGLFKQNTLAQLTRLGTLYAEADTFGLRVSYPPFG